MRGPAGLPLLLLRRRAARGKQREFWQTRIHTGTSRNKTANREKRLYMYGTLFFFFFRRARGTWSKLGSYKGHILSLDIILGE